MINQMKIKITKKEEALLKSNPAYWIMKNLYKEVCITQKEWDNMTAEEKNKLLKDVREKSNKVKKTYDC